MKHIGATLLLLITCSAGLAQDWILKKDEQDIKVYTKQNNSSGFDSFRATMKVNVSVGEITKFLKNMDKYPEAFPETKELKILKRPNDSTQIQYTYTEAPWPVSDRDGVYEMIFRTNSKTGQMSTRARALPSFISEKEGVVRIKRSESYWNATPIGQNKIRLEYIVNADPGGSIPGWLANSAAVDIPFDTFVNIRKALTR